MNMFFFYQYSFMQRVPPPLFCGFWDLKKPALLKICVSGTVGDPLLMQKFPHLHVHRPKFAIVGSGVVKTRKLGIPCTCVKLFIDFTFFTFFRKLQKNSLEKKFWSSLKALNIGERERNQNHQ